MYICAIIMSLSYELALKGTRRRGWVAIKTFVTAVY